ncbi:unnamed protein product [Trifolium pratense]|uniref:Uncharacterized protein n=1 Tax=Trifolium pratense TaxID=57577 RepID=A0ACB0LNL9_TRIPR|nr:unnamed protein product [Trifolium pratense]
MVSLTTTTFEPPTKKRRLIIKLSYPSQNNDQESDYHKKTCYLVTKSQESVVVPIKDNDVVIGSTSTKIINNTVVAAADHKERYFLDPRVDSKNGFDGKLKKDYAETDLLMIKKNKPMEHYKRMQCWVIVKRMIEGRDGWALKESLDLKFLKGLEKNKSKVQKAIGLKDIEAKLKSYSTPDEFAKDMRFVFSQGLLYHPRHIVHRIATKFSETFENKWKSLNEEWTIEERKVKRIHKRKREQAVYDNERKCLSFQQKRSQLCATY